MHLKILFALKIIKKKNTVDEQKKIKKNNKHASENKA